MGSILAGPWLQALGGALNMFHLFHSPSLSLSPSPFLFPPPPFPLKRWGGRGFSSPAEAVRPELGGILHQTTHRPIAWRFGFPASHIFPGGGVLRMGQNASPWYTWPPITEQGGDLADGHSVGDAGEGRAVLRALPDRRDAGGPQRTHLVPNSPISARGLRYRILIHSAGSKIATESPAPSFQTTS